MNQSRAFYLLDICGEDESPQLHKKRRIDYYLNYGTERDLEMVFRQLTELDTEGIR